MSCLKYHQSVARRTRQNNDKSQQSDAYIWLQALLLLSVSDRTESTYCRSLLSVISKGFFSQCSTLFTHKEGTLNVQTLRGWLIGWVSAALWPDSGTGSSVMPMSFSCCFKWDFIIGNKAAGRAIKCFYLCFTYIKDGTLALLVSKAWHSMGHSDRVRLVHNKVSALKTE